MTQDRDILSANVDRMIELADLAWKASPEQHVRLLHAFLHVNRVFQLVVLAHQRAARAAPPERVCIIEDDIPK